MLKVLHGRLVLLFLTTVLVNCSRATYVTHPEINFNPIEALGIAGSYSGISLYRDTEQLTQIEPSVSSVVALTPNDTLKLIASSNVNGDIYDSCLLSDTTLYIAGKFSTISGHIVNNVAAIDLSTNNIKPLQYGLDGPVYSLYCDTDHQAVYVGGSFRAPISNSMVHYTDSLAKFGGSVAVWRNNQWEALPWKGLNGPVYSILKKSTDSILFGGKFDMTTDGQNYHAPASHPIALSANYVTANSTASNSAIPGSIVCANATNTEPWILKDGTVGTIEITFVEYNVNPSLVRIANSKLNNHKTKEFSVRSLTDPAQVYEFKYLDPDTNLVKTCSTNCTLSANPNVDYQDFVITNLSMTSGIAIDVKSWYGVSGGLASVEVFQSEIFTYAVEPQQAGLCTAKSSNDNDTTSKVVTRGGNWQIVTDGIPHLKAKVNASSLSSSPSVTFYPNLQESGVYEVLVYNPSCTTAGCSDRTDVDVTISTARTQTVNVTLSQSITSGASIYTGYFDLGSSDTTNKNSTPFRPSVEFTLAHNASFVPSQKNLVAYAVQFVKYATSPALANILEYNSSVTDIKLRSIPWGPLKDNVPYQSTVKAMALVNNNIYIGGNFSGTDTSNGSYTNILRYDLATDLVKALPKVGPNGMVEVIAAAGNDVYVGGSFSSLSSNDLSKRQEPGISYFSNIAKYDAQNAVWSPLHAGVNGPVKALNLLDNQRLLVSGEFSQILQTSDKPFSKRSDGHAFWNTQDQGWNATDMPYLSGTTYSALRYRNGSYFVGNIKTAQRYPTHGISFLTSQADEDTTTSLQLPTLLNFNPTDTDVSVTSGVIYRNTTGASTSRTMAVLSGKFTLPQDNIKNVAIYDNGTWRGVEGANDWEGHVHSSVVNNDLLYVGGRFSGSKANNLAIFKLPTGTLCLAPEVVTSDRSPASVNIIRHDPIQNLIVLGGNFSSIGSIPCVSVCSFDTKKLQWSPLGSGLLGEVTDVQFVNNKLVASGNLTLNASPLLIAEYDFQKNTWGPFDTATLPGPSRLLAFDNATQSLYITGEEEKTGDTYFRTWNGHQFLKPGQELGPRSVISSLSILPLANSSIDGSSNSDADSNKSDEKESRGILLASGFLNLGSMGNVSAAFYNGTAWIPYLVTANADGSISSSLSSLFHMPMPVSLNDNKGYLPKPLVILVAIAISLGIVFFIVLSAMLILFFKRKRDAKVNPQLNPATYYNKPPMSPDSLLATIKQNNVIHENINFNDKVTNNDNYFGGAQEKDAINTNPFKENENLYNLSRTISREFLNDHTGRAAAVAAATIATTKASHEYLSETHQQRFVKEEDTMAPLSGSNDNAGLNAVAAIKEMSEMPKRHSPFNPFRNLTFDATGAATVSNIDNTDNDVTSGSNKNQVQSIIAGTANDLSSQTAPIGSNVRWTTAPAADIGVAVVKPVSMVSTATTQQYQEHGLHAGSGIGQAITTTTTVEPAKVKWTTAPSNKNAIATAVVSTTPSLLAVPSSTIGQQQQQQRSDRSEHSKDHIIPSFIPPEQPPSSNTVQWTHLSSQSAHVGRATVQSTISGPDTEQFDPYNNSNPSQQLRTGIAAHTNSNTEHPKVIDSNAFRLSEPEDAISTPLDASIPLNFVISTPQSNNVSATSNGNTHSDNDSTELQPQGDIRWRTAKVGPPIETARVPELLLEPASAFVTSRSMTLDEDNASDDAIIPNTTAEKDNNALLTPLPAVTAAVAMGTNALDGRAASKRMVEEYFSSKRSNRGSTAAADDKRNKHTSDFKTMMDSAFMNNTHTTIATEDHPHLYYAKFDFSAREEGELGFEKTDPIIVTDSSDDIWWMGYKADKTDGSCIQGVFPSNYVEKAINIR